MFDCSDVMDPREIGGDVIVHPTALVSRGAQLGKGVVIGPYAVIGARATLEDGVKIGTGAVIDSRTKVGRLTEVYPYATIGAKPQDLKYAGEDTELVVGENNRIREYVNIPIGTERGGGRTSVGSNNLIMAYTHIAHDCHIGNDCVFANGVNLAGHVTVANNVVFGGMSGGHQFCHFGDYVMVGAGSIVVQDVPPYCMVQGDRAEISGLNIVGLRRAGFRGERMNDIKTMFQILYKENLTLEDAIQRIEADVPDSGQKTKFVEFLKRSQRGVCR